MFLKNDLTLRWYMLKPEANFYLEIEKWQRISYKVGYFFSPLMSLCLRRSQTYADTQQQLSPNVIFLANAI